MKNVPMRFCGYTFRHNPATLRISCDSNIRELDSPCCEPRSSHLGNRLRRFSGEGELFGDDCIEQYRRLEKLHESKKTGLLSLPHMPSVYACLKELGFIAQPKENVLEYRFGFIEAEPPAGDDMTAESYVTMIEGETLWDIAYRYGIAIDELVRLNPEIKYIDLLEAGRRVRLC